MKIKTSELSGAALDWAVARAEGAADLRHDGIASWWFTLEGKDRTTNSSWAQHFNPSTDWAQGGPIIEREGVSMACAPKDARGRWRAVLGPNRFLSPDYEGFGTTPLVAAMRCYVASKLGDTVEIPEGLQ